VLDDLRALVEFARAGSIAGAAGPERIRSRWPIPTAGRWQPTRMLRLATSVGHRATDKLLRTQI